MLDIQRFLFRPAYFHAIPQTKGKAMNERDIKLDLLQVCKVSGSDSDFNVTAFHALCDKLKQLGAKEERDKYEAKFEKLMKLHELRESQPNKPCCLAEREACALICDEHADDPVYCGAAIRERGNT